jgi:hypothetical protein
VPRVNRVSGSRGADLPDHVLELADLAPGGRAERDPLRTALRKRRKLSAHSSGLPNAVQASMRARV